MPDELCRITMLEDSVKSIKANYEALCLKQEKQHEETMNALSELKEVRMKDVGFIGGIVFTVSALWAAVTYFLPEFKQ